MHFSIMEAIMLNDEQTLVLEKGVGMVVFAGAGAGKTFVLVKLLMKHLRSLYSDTHWNTNLLSKSVEVNLQAKLLKIVVITFTKKAALELGHRIELEVKQHVDDTPEGRFWNFISSNLYLVTISTIHSYCQKVLKNIMHLLPVKEFRLIQSFELKFKVKKLIEDFLSSEVGGNNLFLEFENKIFVNELLASMVNIFENNELRNAFYQKSFHSQSLQCKSVLDGRLNATSKVDLVVLNFFALFQLENFLLNLKPVQFEKSKKPLKWQEFLEDFNRTLVDDSFLGLSLSERVVFLFENFDYTSLRAPKTEEQELVKFFQNIKEFYAVLKDTKFIESLKLFLNDKDRISLYSELIAQCYQFVEAKYYRDDGITYNDLEFLFQKYLSPVNTSQYFKELIDFMIIDEYQDTSVGQFEIIRMIIQENFQKLIAVGDIKQAIYGFRGGEVHVFKETERFVEKSFSLSYNYRSHEQIVEFNNSFFSYLFPLGIEYQNQDQWGVDYEPQRPVVSKLPSPSPSDEQIKNAGAFEIVLTVNTEKKISLHRARVIEAKVLATKIAEYLRENPHGTVAVLYKALTHNRLLCDELLALNVAYSVQSKVLMKNEPSFLLIEFLLEFLFVEDGDVLWNKKNLIFQLFQFKISESQFHIYLDQFKGNVHGFGVQFAIQNFFFSIGVTDSRHRLVYQKILSYFNLIGTDYIRCFELIESLRNEKVDVREKVDGELGTVEIMSVHSSKGLEFDLVCLAGIHDNGKSMASSEVVGRDPLSFSFRLNPSDRTRQKTPWKLYDEVLEKFKNFSESKRLLYVACTRAKNRLIWINVNNKVGDSVVRPFIYSKNSWINPLRVFSEHSLNVKKEFHTLQDSRISNDAEELVSDDENFENIESADNLDHLDSDDGASGCPPFLRTTMGMEMAQRDKDFYAFMVYGEMPVSKFSEIFQCPRRYYLKNVVKLNNHFEELKLWESASEDRGSVAVTPSSSERGSRVHKMLETILKKFHNGDELNTFEESSLTSSSFDESTRNAIQFALDELSHLNIESMHSEFAIKFSLFGIMINGAIDLWGRSRFTNRLIIVDYKTGNVDQFKLLKYFGQLKLYSYGLLKSLKLNSIQEVEILILSLDEKKVQRELFSRESLIHEVENLYQLMLNPLQESVENCQFCEYQKFCHKSQAN